MVFSTPVFLFYFLVVTLLVYYLVPLRFRNRRRRLSRFGNGVRLPLP